MKVHCPICKKRVKLGAPDFPFCSERCRIQDLSNWSEEKYKVSAPAPQQQDAEDPSDDG
ncbi:MAG TPA: DNA gyrase inhibitor YacG [Candidatus Sulfopaludibacter sp.]|jgi:hypothetical protein|nr:DNA gyrase inhibitor YacG [Candidatus Sulfopaludibacter sp.]